MENTISKPPDFETWASRHESVLADFPGKRILVLFSGGKDSSLSLHHMSRAGKEFGFECEVRAGAFPAHRYTGEEKTRIESYWSKKGINIVWHSLGDSDDIIASAPNPCAVCQELRRKMLQALLAESVKDWARLVVVVSYSLWDIVSYSLERILDIYSSDGQAGNPLENKRFLTTAQRFYPVLTMKEGYTIFRPLITYNTPEIVGLVEQLCIPILSIPCRFRHFRPKKILEGYYQTMGLNFSYREVFQFARKGLDLPASSHFTGMDKERYFLDIF
ncbi:MAG: hypothetical protein C4582_12790 [Desulfobacteraceae bacterium]|jgi:tRNA(Ile)-lysidine synthase TilS/MesJ|nr:MAG: hypothetical protein C4582_12790 [Desulfobacteraceae bacterium]